MKTIKILFLLVLISSLSNVSFGQSWSSGSGKLYVNPVTTKVGIGNTAPNSALHVNGKAGVIPFRAQVNGSTRLLVNTNGGVTIGTNSSAPSRGLYVYGYCGIGTSYPSRKLSVSFNGSIPIRLKDSRTTGNRGPHIEFVDGSYNSAYIAAIFHYGTKDGPDHFRNKAIEIRPPAEGRVNFYNGNGVETSNVTMTITHSGYVGIGTHAPSSKLTVDGKILCEEIQVTASVFPDYVFEDDYNLKTLSEVEEYILLHKHLPEVPSEKEVIDNGLNLGEMDAVLLKKIEELTLYIIEQNKTIESLKSEVNELKK